MPGGWDLLGAEGERSVEVGWERLREVDPEQIILAPCGFDARADGGYLRACDHPRVVR